MNSQVLSFCGLEPQGLVRPIIENNFVFQNDPNFIKKILFDSEGNSVIVNSFIECEHYVTGGWTYSKSGFDELFFIQTLSISIFLISNLIFIIRNHVRKK